MAKIVSVSSIQVFDSRGNPTIRTFVKLDDESIGFATVPSGASTGFHEAFEKRDDDGSVINEVLSINTSINEKLQGFDADSKKVDEALINIDGSENKKNLGANTILSISMALVRALAISEGLPLWSYLRNTYFSEIGKEIKFPQIMVNILNGGVHANWNFDIQEFMVVPNSNTPSKSIQLASNIFHSLGKLLKEGKLSTLVGDEGGYSPSLNSNEKPFQVILEAAARSGYENVNDYRISVDVAASEFYEEQYKEYAFHLNPEVITSEDLIKFYSDVGQRYKILSFEDAFFEDDWESFIKFQKMANQFSFLNIGDDLFTTNPKRIEEGIQKHAANGVIIKPNQIGTISETAEAINLAKGAGWKIVVSHRSGDTEDSFIADLAVACSADFLKSGSMSRSERLSKYNRLLEIEHGI